MTTTAQSLAATLRPLLQDLLARTGAMRCTVRLDYPALGLSVSIPCAEVLAHGAPSMMDNSSVDHRRARSVRWVEAHRRTLVQGDVFADPAMAPPPALAQVFGTRAQLVAPLIGEDDYLFGWLSAHFAHGPRTFTAQELDTMEAFRLAVQAVPGMPL